MEDCPYVEMFDHLEALEPRFLQRCVWPRIEFKNTPLVWMDD